MKTKILIAVSTIMLTLVLASIIGLVIMLLWNWVAVGLFDAPRISFWMAMEVYLTIRLLVLLISGK